MDTLTQTLENMPVREEIITTKDICVKLWREFGKQRITQSELKKELAYAAISPEHGWNELRRKPLPTKPNKGKTFQDMRATGYIQQLSRVQAENLGTIHWLRELKVVFDKEGDIVSRSKVQMRIEEFLLGSEEMRYDKLYQGEEVNYGETTRKSRDFR